ncbi:energy-coupling factor ABC transporter ATP-binding protein [Shewanella sp. WXL01]|uniref:Energy-coupling factor ABC transporter ATP-binding protein n=1 Tax=Shewanella maritima TaxID=2520507 RepID=A0A411PHZ0_9GAMM|nr:MULTISPECIES: energy-coupling factor ABC transporter ATP-binding protein [Shewanella]NKF52039.1 energy-coupling factor ABC transporter ATP-binding protein [Shewanella sp. WXL01]QBF83163.1 energy-coupling factor ABC transporter ATP-binding protein [Shewanella maritima]
MTTVHKAQINAEHVVMRFNDKVLFSFAKLTFAQGDVIYLQGDNGTGKSTLMKLLAGLIHAPEGKFSHQGFEKAAWWRKDGMLGKALYLHQHPYLFDGSVEYNLKFAANQSKLDQSALTERIDQAIEMAQLKHLLTRNASDLSGGERQRLAMARAWIVQPKLLMLDEPISNMDKPSQRLVLAMINQLKDDGTGLLISSHQTCGLTALCQKHWHIAKQQITVSDHVPSFSTQQPINSTGLNYVSAN